MNRAYKFRAYPNEVQRVLIAKTFGCVRFIYNKMLADKITHYNTTKQPLQTTPAKYKQEFAWLKEVDSLALCNAQLHLQTAYNNFFRNPKVGFPNYKSKHRSKRSYSTNAVGKNVVIADNYVKLPKLGMVKVKQHRTVPENWKLKSATVSQDGDGKYFVSVLFEFEQKVTQAKPKEAVGLDFSISELYVDSNGNTPSFPKPYRTSQAKLAKQQRILSRCVRGSSNYRKQKVKVATMHKKIANQRKDFLHKQSRQITNVYDCVGIENLDMKAISQGLNLGKSVGDNGWGMFTAMLGYKLAEQGKQLVKIDKWFPSSKMCSACGKVKKELCLTERVYACDCGHVMDRDVNAAINIRSEALRMIA